MDEQFDRLIENELHSLSYESIPDANPYEHYMNYLIAGLFMIMININIGPLSYIEAVAGWLCMVLALRPLRHAGKWFSDAWLISCIELVYFLINALIANTIYREEIMEKMLAFALNQVAAGSIARTGQQAAVGVVLMVVPIVTFILSQSQILETMASSGLKD